MNDTQNPTLMYYRDSLFGALLATEGLTELAVNRPNQIFTKVNGEWQEHDATISYEECMTFAAVLANHNDDHIDDLKPILSATLESGERCQIVIPPACERGTVSITIRKPSYLQIPHQSWIESGFYDQLTGQEKTESHDDVLIRLFKDNAFPEFMERAMEYGKTTVFGGGTGSGKTTYEKTLLDYIPSHLRLISIEDNPEVKFYSHRNHVHLFYNAEAPEGAIVTPASLLRANFRMNPDRILLTEVRGPETWDFMKAQSSGHEGGVTSLHAPTPEAVIDGIIERCYQNPECRNLPYNVMLRKVLNNIDVIACMTARGNWRRLTHLYFKPLHRDSYFKELSRGEM
ncbi:MAG: P-type DNA transfer ATPase VirB11 [Candidatus Symbiopectobacterium sp. Dall1.0]|nr:P-type DNA transfer ATPase VirB11 [Candidatus Symbiopectobacterium sp. Dall1.0]